jgi:AraC-like DNA-binding protein/mannose-6-phosphate isomerase-like protein (cupin superfamily)
MNAIYRVIKRPRFEILKVENSSHNFPIHIHKRVCIGKIERGEKYLYINGETRILRDGDMFVIPPLTAHSCYAKSYVSYTIVSLETGENIDYKTIFEELESYNFAKADDMIELVKRRPIKQNHIIKAIMEFADDNYSDPITINDIAQKVGYSPCYIQRSFKKNIGLSIHQYILQTRIKKAKEHIKDNTATIALTSGFYDESHFIRNFKRQEGITPKNYYNSIID